MKSFRLLMAMTAVLALSTTAFAQETSSETTKKTDTAKKCTQCPASKTTAVATTTDKADATNEKCNGCTDTFAALPKMEYRVGKKTLCCGESASAVAEKTKEPMKFVVGKKVFDDKEQAFVSLVEQTEAKVKAFVTPSKCEKTGTHTVAGKSCGCSVMAETNAKLVKAAVSKVKMTYVVGKESCACPNQAAAMAKKAGEKTTYVVGKEKTCCSMTARLTLARAQFKAASDALASTTKKAAPAATKKAVEKTETKDG